jgi:glycosyltransferase involved in cell wall biosynthesis
MVSIIVVSHNYGQFLTKCINSILTNNLNYLKEIIIVDDASKDNTSDVLFEEWYAPQIFLCLIPLVYGI